MIKIGVINGSKGILNYLATQEDALSKKPDLTTSILFSICGNLIEKAESIRLLEDNNLESTVGVIARSFIELFVQYKFILKKESNKRSESFYYNYKISAGSKIKNMLLYANDELTKDELKVIQLEIPMAKNYDDFISYYKELSNNLYDNPKNHSQKWYNLHGEKMKFKQLMISSGFNERDYDFFYGLGSLDIHGISSAVNMSQFKLSSLKSTIPIYIIDETITIWLSTALLDLAKFYKLENKNKVKNYLSQITISHEGFK